MAIFFYINTISLSFSYPRGCYSYNSYYNLFTVAGEAEADADAEAQQYGGPGYRNRQAYPTSDMSVSTFMFLLLILFYNTKIMSLVMIWFG